MNNQYAVLISSEIPELGDLDLLCSIYRELNGYMEDYNNQINLDDLGDWKLLIQINLRNTNGIGIFKRAKRFPSNKEFEISISIPVPNSEEARYGISDIMGIYTPLNTKNFYILPPCFSKYDNLYHYIFESAKQAIDAAFTYGFTCNGKRIKKKMNISEFRQRYIEAMKMSERSKITELFRLADDLESVEKTEENYRILSDVFSYLGYYTKAYHYLSEVANPQDMKDVKKLYHLKDCY